MGSWNTLHHEILEKTDVEAFYRELGLEIVGNHAGSNGWIACRAAGREDKHPSATICLEGPAKGRYKDSATGESLNIFDYGVKYGSYSDWKATRKELAKRSGIGIPVGAEPKRPIDSLTFQPWMRSIANDWCKSKDRNIPYQALELAGAKLAMWPQKSPDYHQQGVFAFPGFGPAGVEDEPVAWVIVRDDNSKVQVWKGPKTPPDFEKSICVGGSQPCFLNHHAVANLDAAEYVWKVEGLSDMLVMQGLFIDFPDLFSGHVVLTTAFGASEPVQEWMVRKLTDKNVIIVGDADEPGRSGSHKWAMTLNGKARQVLPLRLPYTVVEKHGKDVRDLVIDRLAGMLTGDVLTDYKTAGLPV